MNSPSGMPDEFKGRGVEREHSNSPLVHSLETQMFLVRDLHLSLEGKELKASQVVACANG